MRKLLGFTLLLLAIMTLAACKDTKQTSQATSNTEQPLPAVSLSVEGEVAHEFYDPASDFGAYQVSIRIKNTGESTIQYDQVVGGFFPKNGKPFIKATRPYDVREEKVLELVPGAVYTVEYNSNGATDDLLMYSMASKVPLQFSLVLSLKDQKITLPFTAELPVLGELPPYQPDKGKGLSLSFRNEAPYKYKPDPAN